MSKEPIEYLKHFLETFAGNFKMALGDNKPLYSSVSPR